MIRVAVLDDPARMISEQGEQSLVTQPVQQCINGLDTICLSKQVTIGQMGHDGGLCLLPDVIFEPAAQFDENIEWGQV